MRCIRGVQVLYFSLVIAVILALVSWLFTGSAGDTFKGAFGFSFLVLGCFWVYYRNNRLECNYDVADDWTPNFVLDGQALKEKKARKAAKGPAY